MIHNFDDISFRILAIDRFHHKEGVFDVNARPYAAFSFRTSGSGQFEIAGKRFATKVGDVLFIPAHESYRVEYSVSESIVVHFEECNYTEAENIHLNSPATIGLKFSRLLECWGKSHSVNQAKALIYEILDEMERDGRASTASGAPERCIRYIDSHFCEPELTVGKVCKLCFVSESSLQRLFAERFGISPKQYLLKLRMNRALELLSEGGHSVREVAFSCGFNDEKYFSRAFKKKYGYPPSKLTDHMIV